MKTSLTPMWEEQDAAEVPAASRAHAPTLSDSSQSLFLQRMAQDFSGMASPELLAEVVNYLREHGAMGVAPVATRSNSAVVVKFVKIMRYIKAHSTPTAIYAAFYVWDEPIFDDINGHLNQTEFAQVIGVTKAAVNNAVKDAARFFGLQPRQDQRKPEACETMRQTIIARLEGQPK